MNLKDLLDALHACGFMTDVVHTGHPDYTRVFVLVMHEGTRVTLGRATVHCGQYSHVKWYAGGGCMRMGRVSPWDFYSYAWNYYLYTHKVLTREQWDNALTEAHRRAQELYDAKLRWRRDNPKPNGGNRGRLAPPNPHRFINELLLEET